MFCSFIFSNTVFVFDHQEYTFYTALLPPTLQIREHHGRDHYRQHHHQEYTPSFFCQRLAASKAEGNLQFEKLLSRPAGVDTRQHIIFVCETMFLKSLRLYWFLFRFFGYSKMNKCSKCKSVSRETEMLLKFPQSVPNSKEKFTM